MDTRTIQTIAATMLSSAVGALFAFYFKDWIEQRRDQRATARESRRLRIRTDRATFNQRLTVLIRQQLAAYVRRGKWYTDTDDLRRLLADLDNGNHEHFLDPEVNRLWQKFVRKTVALAHRRLAGDITALDIRFYNLIRKDWEDAAKRSFGPFPPDRVLVNRSRTRDPQRHVDLAA
jgi:hypothetical protein